METILTIIEIIIALIIIIELLFKPYIDITREKDILLWYGRKKRKYIKLWSSN